MFYHLLYLCGLIFYTSNLYLRLPNLPSISLLLSFYSSTYYYTVASLIQLSQLQYYSITHILYSTLLLSNYMTLLYYFTLLSFTLSDLLHIQPPVMSLAVGQCFFSWEEFGIALEDWCLVQHVEIKVVRKNNKRGSYCCLHKDEDCGWQLYASYNRNHEIEIKTLHSQHTCFALGFAGSVANTQLWLRRVVPKHLIVMKTTTTNDIQNCIRIKYNLSTTAKAAQLVKTYLVRDHQDHQIKQFQQLPAYLAMLKLQHPDLHAELKSTPENRFQRIFICPHESQLSFRHMRKFMAVDGTFLKANFVQTLIFAVGIDANSKNLILA